jgi:ABC-type uncharacterized transport system YnjBCD ATPase subunit
LPIGSAGATSPIDADGHHGYPARACIEGLDIRTQAAQVRAVTGHVPQALSADGELTGHENLLVFARLYGLARDQRRQRIEEALDVMDLREAAHRLVATESGGMIRRLEMAQSMLHRPRALFLDEPTIGLDPVARGPRFRPPSSMRWRSAWVSVWCSARLRCWGPSPWSCWARACSRPSR